MVGARVMASWLLWSMLAKSALTESNPTSLALSTLNDDVRSLERILYNDRTGVSSESENHGFTHLHDIIHTADSELFIHEVVEHCRPTILKIAKLLGGMHCGLIVYYYRISSDGVQHEPFDLVQQIDLGFDDMFNAKMKGANSKASQYHPQNLEDGVTNIWVRWVHPKHVHITNVKRRFNLSNFRISEQMLMTLLHQFNHRFPFYTKPKCNCLHMVTWVMSKLTSGHVGVSCEPGRAARIVIAVNDPFDTCQRHHQLAANEEKAAKSKEDLHFLLEILNSLGFDTVDSPDHSAVLQHLHIPGLPDPLLPEDAVDDELFAEFRTPQEYDQESMKALCRALSAKIPDYRQYRPKRQRVEAEDNTTDNRARKESRTESVD